MKLKAWQEAIIAGCSTCGERIEFEVDCLEGVTFSSVFGWSSDDDPKAEIADMDEWNQYFDWGLTREKWDVDDDVVEVRCGTCNKTIWKREDPVVLWHL